MSDELYHHGILGMKWGVRRFQNEDGTLTGAGRKRYSVGIEEQKKRVKNVLRDGNCITMEDTNGNRKLLKRRHEAKIDRALIFTRHFVFIRADIHFTFTPVYGTI